MRERSMFSGWFGQDATAHIGAGLGFANSGTSTYRTERSAFATGPRLESVPTSHPLDAFDATLLSQKKSCGYCTFTVCPSLQAGVCADDTGWIVEGPANAAVPNARDAATTPVKIEATRPMRRFRPLFD